MWEVQTGEWALLCWMLLVLAKENGKWFMLPIVVHQANNFSQYIYFKIPLEWIFHYPPYRYNYLITLITGYFIYTKSIICHLSPVSPLNRPFKVTMTWDFSFFSLVSSHFFRISFIDVRKTSSPRNPLHKPITTADAKHDISLFWVFTSIFYSMPHTINRAFAISLVTPNYVSLSITSASNIITQNFKPGPSIGTRCICELFTFPRKMVSPISNTPDPYILAHAVWALLMMSHCICQIYIPFLGDNIKVTHADPINTSPFNIWLPIGVHHPFVRTNQLVSSFSRSLLIRPNPWLHPSWYFLRSLI